MFSLTTKIVMEIIMQVTTEIIILLRSVEVVITSITEIVIM